jgi:ubiquinone/menaquinone biosynthesis C-methylase UbiE
MTTKPAPQMLDYWEERAKSEEDPWHPVYEGALDLSNYNFVTRRNTVMRLLEGAGDFERILDVGCGTGDYGELSVRHKGEYHGLDFAYSMIAQARRRNRGMTHEDRFLVGSGETLPYRADSFDLAIGIGYIEYFSDPHLPLAELARVLRPGGVMVIQSFKPELLGKVYGALAHPLRTVTTTRKPHVPKPGEWIDVQYDQPQLDALVAGHGFERIGHVFNHFYVFPGPVRRRFPSLHIKTSEAIGRIAPGLLRSLAVNYFGVYRLAAEEGPRS